MEDRRIAPVAEGEELTLECVSIGKEGDGIMRKEGFVIIVPKAKVHETYNIRITKVLPKIAFGVVVE